MIGSAGVQRQGDDVRLGLGDARADQPLPGLWEAHLAARAVVSKLRNEDPDEEPARRYSAQDVLLARESASPLVRCIIDSEIGRAVTRRGMDYLAYDPYMPGMAGEVGPGQLHPRGKLRRFYEIMGSGADPHSPYQVVAFIAHEVRLGDGGHWAGYRGCAQHDD